MKRYIRKIGRKFQNFVLNHRLGKHQWSARIIIFIMAQFERFEEYKNTGEVNNLDHYVPQFILRRFRIEETGTKKGKLFEFNFKGPLKESNIGESAAKIGHDAFKDKTGKLSDYVSKRLFADLIENRGSWVIKWLDKEKREPDLTYLEESVFAVFLAHQITRGPAFYSAIEKFILYLQANQLLEISDLGNSDFLEFKIVKNQNGVSVDDILSFNPSTSIDGLENHIRILSVLIATEIAEKIYRGNLHILDIPKDSSERFVISDNPVVLLDLERKEILRYPAWWDINKKDLLIFMPISPLRCIFYSKSRRKDSRVERDNIDLVEMVNFGQYLNAHESVFSHDSKIIENHIKMYEAELSRFGAMK